MPNTYRWLECFKNKRITSYFESFSKHWLRCGQVLHIRVKEADKLAVSRTLFPGVLHNAPQIHNVWPLAKKTEAYRDNPSYCWIHRWHVLHNTTHRRGGALEQTVWHKENDNSRHKKHFLKTRRRSSSHRITPTHSRRNQTHQDCYLPLLWVIQCKQGQSIIEQPTQSETHYPLEAKCSCNTSLLSGCWEDTLGQKSVQHVMHIPQCWAHKLRGNAGYL